MSFKHLSLSYRGKLLYIVVGFLVGIGSLVYTQNIARMIEQKEEHEIEMWAMGFAISDKFIPRSNVESDLMYSLINHITNIPIIVTDDYLRVNTYMNVDPSIIHNPELLRTQLEKMSSLRTPLSMILYDGTRITVFYSDSLLLRSLHFFPYIQMGIILVLIGFVLITFSSTKQNEQNRIWVGMAKETAHQLGTPISSLLGWVEYIKSMEQMPEITSEMDRDLERLSKVADRFGKIGSTTTLEPCNIVEIVNNTVNYFENRIPRNVKLSVINDSDQPMDAMVNEALFEWVLENILKNAIDALQGKGYIETILNMSDKWITIDIKDNGKGMPKALFKQIFRPGFSTKTRGWGLGLSLSQRIVEDYHHGKLFVKESEIDVGTTFRIMIHRLDRKIPESENFLRVLRQIGSR